MLKDEKNQRIIGALQRVEEGLRALNHMVSPKPSIESTLKLFRGRYQRLLLPLSTDIQNGFEMAAKSLVDGITVEVRTCHNHATLRATNMELVELYGRQWIGGLEEVHKNLACKHLQDAAKVASLYGNLKSKITAEASSEEIVGDNLEAVPNAAKSFLLEEKIRKLRISGELPTINEGIEAFIEGEENDEEKEIEDLVAVSADQRSLLLLYMYVDGKPGVSQMQRWQMMENVLQ